MVGKKENILKAALELFAKDGYNATATSRIAKKAGVSEGLIFRHFKNKKGLLAAIMDDVELRISQLMGPIIFQEDPKKVLKMFINLPFSIDPDEYNYWRLQFKLKWEPEYHQPGKMKPVLDKLCQVFRDLGYDDPAAEAQLLNQVIDTISIGILREGKDAQLPLQRLLLKKYNV
jgi:AcrR family transcriptional regulator